MLKIMLTETQRSQLIQIMDNVSIQGNSAKMIAELYGAIEGAERIGDENIGVHEEKSGNSS